MDEANRKNPLETDGRNPLPEHLAARERALYEAAAELERLTDQLFGAEGAGRDCAIASEDPIDGLAPDVVPHEALSHKDAQVHHHHTLMDDPRVIVADEPTPGLDLDLAVRALDDFRAFADAGGGVMLITHDIELALRVADRVAVFRDGTVVEETAVANFASPDLLQHPFSRELWHALPEHGFEAPGGSTEGGSHA